MIKTICYELDSGGGSGGSAPDVAPAASSAPEPAPAGQQSSGDGQRPAVDEREAALTLRENTLAAKEALAKAKLPAGFLDIVVQANAETQQLVIDKIAKLWNTELKEAVKSRIAGEVPTNATSASKKFSELTYQEKLSLKRSSPEAYAALVAQS